MRNLSIIVFGVLVLGLSGCGLKLEKVGMGEPMPEFMVRHQVSLDERATELALAEEAMRAKVAVVTVSHR